MATKNLGNRKDIDPGVLRQRRDLYAVSLALIIYFLAGGTLKAEGTFSFLPLSFKSPCVFLYAAWVAWGYFLARYWMLAPKAWAMFREDADWQAAKTDNGREIAKTIVGRRMRQEERAQPLGYLKGGFLARLILDKGVPAIDMGMLADKREGGHAHVGLGLVKVDEDLRSKFWRARYLGWFRAIYCERSFTDYVLPYLVATLVPIVALYSSYNAPATACVFW